LFTVFFNHFLTGTGKNSYVTVTKTEEIFEGTQKGQHLIELRRLKEILSKFVLSLEDVNFNVYLQSWAC
jgi:hypothetical protein